MLKKRAKVIKNKFRQVFNNKMIQLVFYKKAC